MKASSLPSLITKIWGYNGSSSQTRTIPDTTTDQNAASWNLGFPPNTFVDPSAGGAAPDGRDFNGTFTALSSSIVGIRGQGIGFFDSNFSTNINGYPQYAHVATSDGKIWRSTVDNNTATPGDNSGQWTEIFRSSLASSGFICLPNGYIRQWGQYNSGNTGKTTVTFPIAFPNQAFGALVVENGANGAWSQNSPVIHASSDLTNTTLNVVTLGPDSTSSTGWSPRLGTGNWEAWGH